ENIYGSAPGCLGPPAEAEDARREILREFEDLGIDVGNRRSRATLLAIAARQLLARPLSLFERPGWTCEALGEDLVRGSDEPLPPRAFGEHSLSLVEEVRLGCWQ